MLEGWFELQRQFSEYERRCRAEELLREGIDREVENPVRATGIYLRLGALFADIRDLAAEAWWRLGLMAERRGDVPRALTYFRIVRARYGEQADVARLSLVKIMEYGRNPREGSSPHARWSPRLHA